MIVRKIQRRTLPAAMTCVDIVVTANSYHASKEIGVSPWLFLDTNCLGAWLDALYAMHTVFTGALPLALTRLTWTVRGGD